MIVAKMHIKCGSNAYIRNRNTFDAELKPFQIRLMFTGIEGGTKCFFGIC